MNHYRRKWSTLAAAILLAGNLSIAVPAFADQLPASNQPTTSQTAQAAASQSRQQGKVDQPQTTNPAETGRFANQSAGALAQQVRDGKINDQGLINDTYRQIDQQNHQLNNVIYINLN